MIRDLAIPPYLCTCNGIPKSRDHIIPTCSSIRPTSNLIILLTNQYRTPKFSKIQLCLKRSTASISHRRYLSRQVYWFSSKFINFVLHKMDSPWRYGQYSPSAACEIAPQVALDADVCHSNSPSPALIHALSPFQLR